MNTNFNKLTIEVYKNNKLVNTLENTNTDKEQIQKELISDLLSTYFNKKHNISEANYYNKLKVKYTEQIGSDKFVTYRIYTNVKEEGA